jgi:hypothetical protein
MKLSTPPPVPFGVASLCEYFQVELKHPADPGVILERLNTSLPCGARALACRPGRLGQVKACTYTTSRPFSLCAGDDATIIKGDSVLRVRDFLEDVGPDTMRIAFVDGRTISPVMLLTAFSHDGIRPSEIMKPGVTFTDARD